MATERTVPSGRKKKQLRGFVMTGGGAKGLYEAGVIHALHICGMDFDVITGSSVGALNSVFYAEYLFRKRQLPATVLQDPLQTVDAMDGLVKAFHHAWLQLPDKKLIDDSEQGPLGLLKEDLLHFELSVPAAIRVGWWWTDPKRGVLPPADTWTSSLGLAKELVERVGGGGVLLQLLKDHRLSFFREAARTYLARFKMDHSLIPPFDDHKLRDVFTQPVSPLCEEHLSNGMDADVDAQGARLILVDPDRTLRDYGEKDIAVRLTRANYRTGRLEISAWVTMQDFVGFLKRQAWRLDAFGPDQIPLGSFRLEVPGNPNAINAAICSGRFPGVFTPYKIEDIYPASDPENLLLAKLLSDWLVDPELESCAKEAYLRHATDSSSNKWETLYSTWRDSSTLRDFFPQATDTYVDGGTIDNTPTNSAVDFAREWAERNELSKRDMTLDLFTIFLDTEPKIGPDEAKAPTIFEVVSRTLNIQGAAKKSSDANTVDTINAFGQHGEELGRVLQALLASYSEALSKLPPIEAEQALAKLRQSIRTLLIHNLPGNSGEDAADGLLHAIDQWSKGVISRGLPLQVNIIKIYPEEMPLGTLQFTERLGYRKEDAIRMLTMGCHNTLTALRGYLKKQAKFGLEPRDRHAFRLIREWTGDLHQSDEGSKSAAADMEWRCQRTTCVFHRHFCSKGASRNAS